MKSIHLLSTFVLTCIGLTLLAPPASAAAATSEAQNICLAEVRNNYREKVRNLSIINSENSGSSSKVIVQADGDRWRCVVAKSGELQELTKTDEVKAGGHNGGTENAKSTCMSAVNSSYGGKVRNLDVVKAEHTGSNIKVIVKADGERWRCIASGDGMKVEDLSVQ